MENDEHKQQGEADGAADADAYYGDDDAGMDEIDLSFLDDEESAEQEKHSA